MNKFLTAAALALAMTMPVQAAEQGRLDILLEYEGEGLDGTFEVIPVADYNDETGAFEYEDAFEGCSADLSALNESSTSKIIADWAVDNNLDGVDLTAVDGTGFVTLDDGLYLVEQTTAEDGYDLSSPFLVMLPDENGSLLVSAHPKTRTRSTEEGPEVPTEPETSDKTQNTNTIKTTGTKTTGSVRKSSSANTSAAIPASLFAAGAAAAAAGMILVSKRRK